MVTKQIATLAEWQKTKLYDYGGRTNKAEPKFFAGECGIFVGSSARTDAAGAQALRSIVADFGYEVVPVGVTACLHLKSAVTAIDEGAVLANPDWVDLAPLDGIDVVRVPIDEPGAANVLRVAGCVLAHAGFPRTIDLLAARGMDVRPIDVSEFLKAEAGVTCKSLVFRARHAGAR